MKHIKMFGFAVLVVAALGAFLGAGSAAATELYSGSLTLPSGTEITASLSGTASLTTTEGTTLDTCTGGSVNGKTSTAGSATTTVKGPVAASGVTWSNCTFTTDTLAGGELEIHVIGAGPNGTLTGSGFEVTINTVLFGSCIFTLGTGTDLGTLTGKTAEEDAVMDINAIATRKSGLCPSTAKWVGTYKVTTVVYNGTHYTRLHVTPS
jgi:hypothetical protein